MKSLFFQNNISFWIRNICYEIAPIVITIMCVYLLSYLVFGSLFARYHDNLNSEFVYNVVIGRFMNSGFDPTEFDVFLGGSTRWYHYARVLSPSSLIYAICDPKNAYFVTEILFRIVAYYSVIMLGNIYRIPRYQLVVLGLSYSLLLSFTTLGIGLHVAPLVLYFVMREKPVTLATGALILFLGLNSSLALHALFLPLAILISRPLIDIKFSLKRYLFVIFPYLFGAFIGSFGLIYAQIFGEVSHRSVWVLYVNSSPSWFDIFKTIINGLITNQQWYHAVFVTHFKLSLGILACIIMLISFNKNNQMRALYFILIVSLISMLDIFGVNIMNMFPDIFNTIQIFRIGFFVPMITLLLVLAVLSSPISSILKKTMVLCTCAVFLSGAAASAGMKLSQLASKEDKTYLKNLFLSGEFAELLKFENINKLGIDTSRHENFNSFFNSHEMACISDLLPLDKDQRVASFGINPMVAVYHGIPVIDGLHNFYPLWYKEAFIPIIESKMEHSESMKDRINGWGSRLHLFADKYAPDILPDFQKTTNLGATYILSDREIVSPNLIEIKIDCGARSAKVYKITHQD